jgi:hypothetical protein
MLRIRTTHQHMKRYLGLLNNIPEVLGADRVTGEDCFVVHCSRSPPADLETILDALAVHRSVTTPWVLSNAVRKQVSVRPRSNPDNYGSQDVIARRLRLIQSAPMSGHDPYVYLKDVLTRLPTQKVSKIEQLLPHQWMSG